MFRKQKLVRQILPQSQLICGKKTTEAIKTAALFYGAEKSMVKLRVSTPQATFLWKSTPHFSSAADIYTAI